MIIIIIKMLTSSLLTRFVLINTRNTEWWKLKSLHTVLLISSSSSSDSFSWSRFTEVLSLSIDSFNSSILVKPTSRSVRWNIDHRPTSDNQINKYPVRPHLLTSQSNLHTDPLAVGKGNPQFYRLFPPPSQSQSNHKELFRSEAEGPHSFIGCCMQLCGCHMGSGTYDSRVERDNQ